MSLVHREAGLGGRTCLLVHGYPNSSYLWRDVMEPIAAAGWRAVAPDLPGFGSSPLAGSTGTWEEHVEALGGFVEEHDLAPLVLVVHDWGGLIGLRWACDHPDAVRGLVLSGTGFFADGRWHGLAQAMRTPGRVDAMMESLDRDGLAGLLRQAEPGADDAAIDEYWRGFATPEQRHAHLALYRSGDFEKLAPYEGRLAALGVPTLLLWGAKDDFAPVGGAHRFAREIPHAELVVLDEAGHFPMEDEPERVAAEVVRFLGTIA
jgi:haloalkane dehalogenase